MVTNLEGSEITVPLKNSGKQRKVIFTFYKNLALYAFLQVAGISLPHYMFSKKCITFLHGMARGN